MCNVCKSILSGRTSLPEARKNLPRLIDLEQNKIKKEHYKQLYGNMEKAYSRIFGSKTEKTIWKEK